jgi:hypothetical protein
MGQCLIREQNRFFFDFNHFQNINSFSEVLVSAINSLIFQNLWWLNLWNQIITILTSHSMFT